MFRATLMKLALVLCIPLLAGAAEAQERSATLPFATPTGKELKVTTGEVVFEEGSVMFSPTLIVRRVVKSTMPGSMMVPFRFWVPAGEYPLTRSGGEWTITARPWRKRAPPSPA